MVKYYEKKYKEWGEEMNGMTLEKGVEYLVSLMAIYGASAKLRYELTWDNVDCYIDQEREETVGEKQARLEKENKQTEKDRKKFEALQAKYGWK